MKSKVKILFTIAIVLAFVFTSCDSDVSSSSGTSSSSTTTATTTTTIGLSSYSATSSGYTTAGSASSSSWKTGTYVSYTTGSATSLTDTSNNTIYSGTATISFDGTSKTISAAYLINNTNVTITSGQYESASSSSDEVVFLVVNGGSLTITGTSSDYIEITKSGSAASNGQVGDDYNFYGINSGIVVAGEGSSATITYAAINTTGNGSNAVVATAEGTVTISNSTITTTGSAGARGLHATYSGTITASNVTITTSGASCAALATDRGGGSINATGMNLTTNSNGSPLVYSTGSIVVSSSEGTANSAQMVVVEGNSEVHLTSCDFSCTGDGNRTGTSESSSSSHTIDKAGIFIYQSASGDSSDGTDYFSATNCTLKVTKSDVPMFYLTNIEAVITLSGNTFTSASSDDYFIMCEETNQWGTVGSNGSDTVLYLNQDLSSPTVFVGGSSSNSLLLASTSTGTATFTVNSATW